MRWPPASVVKKASPGLRPRGCGGAGAALPLRRAGRVSSPPADGSLQGGWRRRRGAACAVAQGDRHRCAGMLERRPSCGRSRRTPRRQPGAGHRPVSLQAPAHLPTCSCSLVLVGERVLTAQRPLRRGCVRMRPSSASFRLRVRSFLLKHVVEHEVQLVRCAGDDQVQEKYWNTLTVSSGSTAAAPLQTPHATSTARHLTAKATEGVHLIKLAQQGATPSAQYTHTNRPRPPRLDSRRPRRWQRQATTAALSPSRPEGSTHVVVLPQWSEDMHRGARGCSTHGTRGGEWRAGGGGQEGWRPEGRVQDQRGVEYRRGVEAECYRQGRRLAGARATKVKCRGGQ